MIKYFCDKCKQETKQLYRLSLDPKFDLAIERKDRPEVIFADSWGRDVCNVCAFEVTQLTRWEG